MDIENATVVTEGRQWEKDLPDLGDLEVLVAPWENPEFDRMVQKLTRALPPALRPDGVVEPRSWTIILGKAIARTILFDWKNYKLGGVEKPFDQEYAEAVMTNPKYKPVRDAVITAAKRVQLGVKAQEEQVLGNSQRSSPGSENGQATSRA